MVSSLILYVVNSLSTLIIFKILTANNTVDVFSSYVVIISFAGLIYGLPFTPIQQFMLREISKSTAPFLVLNYILKFFGFAFLIVSSILYLLNPLWDRFVDIELMYLLPFIFTEVLKIYIYSFLNIINKKILLTCVLLIEFSIKFMLLNRAAENATDIVSSITAANIIYVMIYISVIIKSSHRVSSLKIGSSMITYCWPLTLWSIFSWMRDVGSRIFLDQTLSSYELAGYSVMMTIAVIVPSFVNSFFSIHFIPVLYKVESHTKGSMAIFFKNHILKYSLFTLFSTLVVFISSKLVIQLLSTDHYAEFADYLAPMYMSMMLYIGATLTNNILLYYGANTILLIFNVLFGVVSACGFMVVPKFFGLEGAFITYISLNIASAFGFLLISLLYAKKNSML